VALAAIFFARAGLTPPITPTSMPANISWRTMAGKLDDHVGLPVGALPFNLKYAICNLQFLPSHRYDVHPKGNIDDRIDI
jgi:hypothetical protein